MINTIMNKCYKPQEEESLKFFVENGEVGGGKFYFLASKHIEHAL